MDKENHSSRKISSQRVGYFLNYFFDQIVLSFECIKGWIYVCVPSNQILLEEVVCAKDLVFSIQRTILLGDASGAKHPLSLLPLNRNVFGVGRLETVAPAVS